MVKAFKVALLAGALLVTVEPLTARALGFPALPPIIPDICASFMGCDITFTNSQLLLQVQHYFAMVQNFKNISNIAGAQGAIQQAVGMVQAAKAAPPEEEADAAADDVLDTTPDTQARIAAIDAQAQSADGVQEQSQVQGLYESTIAGNTAQTNALLAEQQKQRQDEINGAAQALITLNGVDRPIENGL